MKVINQTVPDYRPLNRPRHQSKLITAALSGVARLTIGFIFGFVLYIPVSYDWYKAGAISIVFMTLALERAWGAREMRMHGQVARRVVFFVGVGLCYVLLGLLNGAPGALFSSMIFVIWPIVYAIFIARSWTTTMLLGTPNLCIFGSIAIGLAMANEVLFGLGILPEFLHFTLSENQAIVYYDGYTRARFYSISSLVYLVPFLIGFVMTRPDRNHKSLPGALLIAALILSTGGLLVSGRRAGLINVALAPIFTIIFARWLPNKKMFSLRMGFALLGILVVGVIILIALVAVTNFRLTDQLLQIAAGFDSSQETLRFDQFSALLDGWLRSPIWGNGLGSVAEAVIRSENRPWEYELQYSLLLFHTGIIGVCAYATGVIWIFLRAREVIRNDPLLGPQLVPVLVGTACFLVANATNPYLQAYGHLWTLFLPIAFVNSYLLRRKARNLNDPIPEPLSIATSTGASLTAHA